MILPHSSVENAQHARPLWATHVAGCVFDVLRVFLAVLVRSQHLPRYLSLREPATDILMRKHHDYHEYVLLADTGRSGSADSVLEYLHWVREAGAAVAKEQLDYPWALAGQLRWVRFNFVHTLCSIRIVSPWSCRSYEQYCDLSRQYDPNPSPAVLPDGTVVPPYNGPGLGTFVEEFGRWDLLDFSTSAHVSSSADSYSRSNYSEQVLG